MSAVAVGYAPAVMLLAAACISQAEAATQKQTPDNSAQRRRVYHVSTRPLASVDAASQFRTISEAARIVEPGDSVQIHDGTYRESVTIERSGTPARPIRFEAAPYAHVVITGADRLLGWQKEGAEADNIFSTAWAHEFIRSVPTRSFPAGDYHSLIGRAEQVHIADFPLRQVLAREQLSRGTFFVDPVAKRIFVWAANNAKLTGDPAWTPDVEASARSVLWNCKGGYVQVRGLRFRFAANRAQEAATVFLGKGDLIEDCIFERANSCGAAFLAPDQVVRGCTFQENGQIGFVAVRAHRLRMTGCVIRNNNTKDFSQSWEAGGNKIVLSRDVVIEHSQFIGNRGPGIWFDIGNENCTVRNCLISDNLSAGIFYEISYGLRAQDNVITGNGFDAAPQSWGLAAGISLSSSAGCLIERNLLVGNREGFNFREQDRTTVRIDDHKGAPQAEAWVHDDTVRRNVIAYNREAQTWGWFNISDERHWPVALREKMEPGMEGTRFRQQVQPGALAAPPDLSLEKLKLDLRQNVYASTEGQGVFRWGVPWQKHEYYDGRDALEKVRKRLNLEQRSVVVPLAFADWRSGDFRLPANSVAFKRRAYPRGEVPSVKLGKRTAR